MKNSKPYGFGFYFTRLLQASLSNRYKIKKPSFTDGFIHLSRSRPVSYIPSEWPNITTFFESRLLNSEV